MADKKKKSDKESKKSDKESKKNKYPKEEMEPYNPFAVCTKSVGRDDEEKYESCIQQVKQQNKERNMKKKEKRSAEDRLMEKVSGLMDDAGVYMGGQGRLPLNAKEKQLLQQILNKYTPQVKSMVEALDMIDPELRTPAVDLRIQRIKNAFTGIISSLSNEVADIETSSETPSETPPEASGA